MSTADRRQDTNPQWDLNKNPNIQEKDFVPSQELKSNRLPNWKDPSSDKGSGQSNSNQQQLHDLGNKDMQNQNQIL